MIKKRSLHKRWWYIYNKGKSYVRYVLSLLKPTHRKSTPHTENTYLSLANV